MAAIARHCEQPRRDAHQRAATKSLFRQIAFGLTVIIAEIVTGGSVKASEVDAELTIREVIPAPFRCSRTSEPFFLQARKSPGPQRDFGFAI